MFQNVEPENLTGNQNNFSYKGSIVFLNFI